MADDTPARAPRRRIQRQSYTKICEHCGETFTSVRSHTRFCSSACVSRAWAKANPERTRDYARGAWQRMTPEQRKARNQRARERRAKGRPIRFVRGTANTHRDFVHGRDWQTAYAEFWEAQDGRCYLCGDPLDDSTPQCVVFDHNHECCPAHKSCRICRRGLACNRCNRAIGYAFDDPERLRRMADALEAANAAFAERLTAQHADAAATVLFL